MPLRRRAFTPGEPSGAGVPAVGDEVPMDVLGLGRVRARVEAVTMLTQEGVRDLAWRVALRLPDGSRAEGIVRGHARMAFLDPRHRLARRP